MKTRHWFPLLLIVGFCMVMPAHGAGDATPNDVWVAVRANDRGEGQGWSEYYGTIDRRTFAVVTSSTNASGFLRLDHAAFMGDGVVHSLTLMKDGEANLGYGDVVYLRLDTVVRIVVLDETFVKDHLPERK